MDQAKLKEAIEQSGLSLVSICEKLGISRTALYRKLNGITEFKQGEMVALAELLGLPHPEAIFFCKESVQKETE